MNPTSAASRTPWQRKALLGLLATVLVLAVVEIASRFVLAIAPPPPNERMASAASVFVRIGGLEETDVDELFVADPQLFWRLRPSVVGHRWRPPLWIDCRSNSLGLRDEPATPIKAPGTFRVLALGDSCTYGSGVLIGDSYPNRLEVRLGFARQQRISEVLNAGCPGYTLYQGVTYLEREGLALAPDLVTLAFGFNDRNTWGSVGDSEFARAQNTWIAGLGRSLDRLALVRMMRSGLTRANQGNAPGPIEGSALRVPPDEFARLLVKAIELCRARGVPVVILLWPLRPQIADASLPLHEWQKAMREVATAHGVPLLDLVERLRGEDGLFIPNDNCHMTTKGCDRVADELFKLLDREHLIDGKN